MTPIYLTDELWLDLKPGLLESDNLSSLAEGDLRRIAEDMITRVGDGETTAAQDAAAVSLALKAKLRDHDIPDAVMNAAVKHASRGPVQTGLLNVVIGHLDPDLLERMLRYVTDQRRGASIADGVA